MFFKALLCVFAVSAQSYAGSCYRKTNPAPSCGCVSNRASISVTEGAPVYSREGIAVSEDQSSYKSISASPSFSENGGTMTVTSISPIAPSGIAVATDLGLTGDLALYGELPYLSAVAFEGQFDSSGSAAVSYGCGDGSIAITEQIGGNDAGTYGISSLSGCGCGKY